MVAGAVEEEDRLLRPVRRFTVQLPHQVPQEDQHHVAVRVSVRQREVDPALGVERSDQGQSWDHRPLGDRSSSIAWAPHPPREVRLVQPRLINVDDSSTRLEERQHLHRVLLPKHEAALAVALDRHLLDSPIAKAELLLHRQLDLGQADLNIVLLLHLLLHLSGLFDRD